MKIICYCNNVSYEDMKNSYRKGHTTLEEIIEDTNAMKNSNCLVNNPNKRCCYIDLEAAYKQIVEEYQK